MSDNQTTAASSYDPLRELAFMLLPGRCKRHINLQLREAINDGVRTSADFARLLAEQPEYDKRTLLAFADALDNLKLN